MKQAKLGPEQAKYTIRLPRELLRRADALAARQGRTLNATLNALVEAYVAAQGQQDGTGTGGVSRR